MTEAAPERSTIEGRRLGRYVLRRLVARGGMASVYLAQLSAAKGFDRWVAVKIVHPHLAAEKRFTRMFLDEARVTSRLRHPNVCDVIDFGTHGKVPYLVMEYLHGESLSRLMRPAGAGGEPLPCWLAARICADVARGLHAAHELRDDDGTEMHVVHRDVSPHNLMVLYDGPSKVVDFGVARARGRLTSTTTGELKGKLSYMAPEQLERGEVDRRTDVWALGVVLWEASVGQPLFRGEHEGETLMSVLKKPVPRPGSIREGYPAALASVVMTALHRNPAARWASAAAMADALDAYLASTGEPTGPAQVARFLGVRFADRKARRDAILRSEPIEGPVEEVDLGTLLAEASYIRQSRPRSSEEPDADEDSMSDPFAGMIAADRPAPRRLRPLGIALGIVLASAIAGAALALFLGSGPDADDVASIPTGSAGATLMPANVPTTPRAAPSSAAPSSAAPSSAAPSSAGPSSAAPSSAAPSSPAPSSPASEVSAAADEVPVRERAAATTPGRLNLLTVPAAVVTFRGRRLGYTPLRERELPPGRHPLVLRPEGGGPSRLITVDIRSGELTRRSVVLDALPVSR